MNTLATANTALKAMNQARNRDKLMARSPIDVMATENAPPATAKRMLSGTPVEH
jgi:hypothetical protein